MLLVSVGLALAFAAGFFVATLIGSPSEPDNVARLTVLPENGIITIGRLPSAWPAEFPLPKQFRSKWAVATDGDLWTCFTYEPVGPLGSRLVRVIRQGLRSAGYDLGPITQEEPVISSFLYRFAFYSDFSEVPPDHEGFVTVPDNATALELGGIGCGFSVELKNYT